MDWLADGRDALVRIHDEPYDLVILDLGLPGLDGLALLRRWRQDGETQPVLILTARDSWAERVEGLRAGADDYLREILRGRYREAIMNLLQSQEFEASLPSR